MDLLQLSYFKAIADNLNMTKAANEVHVSQPALSKAMQQLETDLGTPLFDRNGKKLTLNEYGKLVYAYSNNIFNTCDDMSNSLKDLREGTSGYLKIATSFPTAENNAVYSILKDYMWSHENIHVSYHQMAPIKIKKALEQYNIDLAFSSLPIITDEIEWVELYRDKIGVILSKDNPLAEKLELTLLDLKNEKFVCNQSQGDTFGPNLCMKAGFKPNIVFDSDSPEICGELVSKNRGISLIGKEKFKVNNTISKTHNAWESNIVFRPLSDDFCERLCGMAYLKNRYFSKAVHEFKNIALKELKTAD